MAIKILAPLLVVVSLIAAWQYWRIGRLADRLQTTEQQLEAHREAARVLNEYIERAQAANQRWRGVLRDIEAKDGRDAPLNDYERAVLGSVRASPDYP